MNTGNLFRLRYSRDFCVPAIKIEWNLGNPFRGGSGMKQTAKAAGWLYFLIILTSLLSLFFLGGKYTVMGDNQATLEKMAEHAGLVRVNSAYEILMFSAVIALSAGLFELLKKTGPALARAAMLLRVGEALLGYVTVLCTLAVT